MISILSPVEPQTMPMPAVGERAPDFALQNGDGATVRLSDLSGRTVVLYFYPRDNTPGCTKEAYGFRDNLDRLTAKGAVVLGVSADSTSSHQRFTAKHGLNFPLLSDPEKQAIQDYGVWVEKSLAGRTYMGIQRATFLIDAQGQIARVWPKVKPAGHAAEVLAALEQ